MEALLQTIQTYKSPQKYEGHDLRVRHSPAHTLIIVCVVLLQALTAASLLSLHTSPA